MFHGTCCTAFSAVESLSGVGDPVLIAVAVDTMAVEITSFGLIHMINVVITRRFQKMSREKIHSVVVYLQLLILIPLDMCFWFDNLDEH